MVLIAKIPIKDRLLTLSAHAREGYGSCLSVCQSVCHFSILEKASFSLKLTSVYNLGDDFSPLNLALF